MLKLHIGLQTLNLSFLAHSPTIQTTEKKHLQMGIFPIQTRISQWGKDPHQMNRSITPNYHISDPTELFFMEDREFPGHLDHNISKLSILPADPLCPHSIPQFQQVNICARLGSKGNAFDDEEFFLTLRELQIIRRLNIQDTLKFATRQQMKCMRSLHECLILGIIELLYKKYPIG